ncbi:hypothetical protein D8676_25225 [Mesorhizobium sp. YM1C-6-2]|nr:hypothetical protein D8676_25225 [Mesorhizobium sp. YM1C-6-2]
MRSSRAAARKAKAAAKKRAASLATRKFAFEDMINGDPMCKLADLKVVRHYLRFVDDFEKDAVYASTIDV